MDDHQFALCVEFCSVCRLTDDDLGLAQFYLADTGWKLEEAVMSYKQSQSDAQSQDTQPAQTRAESRNTLASTVPVAHATEAVATTTSQARGTVSRPSTSASSLAAGEPQSKKLCPSTSSEESQQKKKFRLITWNIDGLDERNTRERTSEVCNVLKRNSPDIVFLQEVIPLTFGLIESLMPDYKVIPASRDGYFTAVMLKKSSVQLLSCEVAPFPSSAMMRALQIVKAKCAGVELCLICTHLESTKPHAKERINQLKLAFDRMKKAPLTSTVIFGGDCNLRDPEVAKANMACCISDIWQLSGEPADAKFTWDLSQNDNLDWPYPNRPKCRFDRLFLSQAAEIKIVTETFSFIGKQRIHGCHRFPSDHWGIMCDFKVKE